MKSYEGAIGLWVPPSKVTADGAAARRSAGSTVCITSVALPAVPTRKVYSPARTAPGAKATSSDPSSAPSTRAPPSSAAARSAVRCCRRSPGFERPARTLTIRSGVPVTSESESDERSICPPPSPSDPSSVTMPASSVFTRSPLHADHLT